MTTYLNCDAYHDAHYWVFTPSSFVRLCHDLVELDLLKFSCSYCIPTARNEFEFYASLVPGGDRNAMLESWRKADNDLT